MMITVAKNIGNVVHSMKIAICMESLINLFDLASVKLCSLD